MGKWKIWGFYENVILSFQRDISGKQHCQVSEEIIFFSLSPCSYMITCLPLQLWLRHESWNPTDQRLKFYKLCIILNFCIFLYNFFHNTGFGDMAVSNAIGSNVFDILICLGLPWFLSTVIVHPGVPVRVISKG